MQVHICIPYRTDKNLGKAYNEVISRIPDGDAACLIDYDVQLLTPDAGAIIEEYFRRCPDSLLTCYTNRLSPANRTQLLTGQISEDSDIRNHIQFAEVQKSKLYQLTEIHADISGMLMIIPKSLWRKLPFPESGKCLGLDTHYGRAVRSSGGQIFRMEGLYVWHAYRLATGVHDKSHLK